MSNDFNPDADAVILKPILETTRRFYIVFAILLMGVGIGVISYVHQYRNGLGVTGLNDNITWGFYITNFVFFIGISHAGTLISAILRICQAEWRRPITRMAEVITVMVLAIGAANVLIKVMINSSASNMDSVVCCNVYSCSSNTWIFVTWVNI